jgi:hypothetical protein
MKIIKYILLLTVNAMLMPAFGQQPFKAGNIVLYRVGDGSTSLSFNAAPVYLDEYTVDGVLVQSIPMPITTNGANSALTAHGRITTEGMLNLSADGKRLLVPGTNSAIGSTITTASVIGVVDFNGKINTSTAITDFTESGHIPTTATSFDGTRFWFSGTGAVRYATAGSSTSVLISNTGNQQNDLKIADGQLYVSSAVAPASVYKIGNGTPVTDGQILTALPGLPANISGPGQFAIADMDASVPGVDVLYVASTGNLVSPTIGIRKFSLVSGTWVSNGSVGGETDNSFYMGLTVKVTGNTVTIFSTRRGANSTNRLGGELVKLVDNSGYNGALTGTPVVLASAAPVNNMAFRGVALVPQPAPFTPGNIVAYRVGDGSTSLSFNAVPVYLDEYTVDGTLVQSIMMPTATNGANSALTAHGRITTEGMLNLSADGKYLLVPGTNTPIGSPTTTAAVIGVVDFNSKVNTSTAITDFTESGHIPFTAVSPDGTGFWFSGTGAVRYSIVGSNTSVVVSNTGNQQNDLKIVDGQLYASSAVSPASVYKIGNGTPVTGGQTLTALPGLPANISGPGQFAFADMDAGVPGVDVLYVASTGNLVSPTVGIRKFSLVSGTWVSNGSVGGEIDNSFYMGLTIKIAANTVMIFSTRRGANSTNRLGGELVKLVDNSGYNGALTGTPVVLASATPINNMAFRGVSRVPAGCPPVPLLQVPGISSTQANIIWNAPGGGSGNYEYAITLSAAAPASGTAIAGTSVSVTGLINATTYYVHVRTVCSASSKSEWVTESFTTGCKAPASPAINLTINSSGVVTAKWNKVFGADGYEYFISTNPVSPASGAAISDTSLSISNLNTVTEYYLHIRSNCGAGTFSPWVTKAFTTGCFMPAASVTVLARSASVKWNKVPDAIKYEYALTYDPAKPVTGTYTTDTVYAIDKVNEGAAYYFHIRAICRMGNLSEWSTTRFTVRGLQVYPNPVTDMLHVQINGLVNPSAEIIISDIMGRVIKRVMLNNGVADIDIRTWATGFYFVRNSDATNKYTVKILKQ